MLPPLGTDELAATSPGDVHLASPPEENVGHTSPPMENVDLTSPPVENVDLTYPPVELAGVLSPPAENLDLALAPEGIAGVSSPPEGIAGSALLAEMKVDVCPPPEGNVDLAPSPAEDTTQQGASTSASSSPSANTQRVKPKLLPKPRPHTTLLREPSLGNGPARRVSEGNLCTLEVNTALKLASSFTLDNALQPLQPLQPRTDLLPPPPPGGASEAPTDGTTPVVGKRNIPDNIQSKLEREHEKQTLRGARRVTSFLKGLEEQSEVCFTSLFPAYNFTFSVC